MYVSIIYTQISQIYVPLHPRSTSTHSSQGNPDTASMSHSDDNTSSDLSQTTVSTFQIQSSLSLDPVSSKSKCNITNGASCDKFAITIENHDESNTALHGQCAVSASLATGDEIVPAMAGLNISSNQPLLLVPPPCGYSIETILDLAAKHLCNDWRPVGLGRLVEELEQSTNEVCIETRNRLTIV